MSAQKQWVFDPDAAGVKIPERIKREVQRRVETVAEKHLTGKYTRLGIHFRGQFCYIDAYREPPKPNQVGPQKTGRKQVTPTSNDCATRRRTFAACATLAMTGGVMHSTFTVARNTN